MKESRNHRPRAMFKALLSLFVLVAVSLACINIPLELEQEATQPVPRAETAPPLDPGLSATQDSIPTLTPGPGRSNGGSPQPPTTVEPSADQSAGDVIPATGGDALVRLFAELSPGVVSIQIYSSRSGMNPLGSGSGFILDNEGHIVTNNHVVAGGNLTTVVFFNGIELPAEIVGTDPESDLAVVRVGQLPEGTYPLTLGDSDRVVVGEQVIAIGNPFGLAGSMTTGIVSAIGRNIPTGVTPFSIPQAIQTDAAINPGNSGGPLINLNGEIIGVNAQIATSGGMAGNVGVGFAIPSNIVRRVAPVLIEQGVFQWPYLGIEGTTVNYAISTVNNLPQQSGVYIDAVRPNGPAERAGLRGSTRSGSANGLSGVPAGGDVIIAADGVQIKNLGDLLVSIAAHNPGEIMRVTVLRDGQQIEVDVELLPRPANFENENP